MVKVYRRLAGTVEAVQVCKRNLREVFELLQGQEFHVKSHLLTGIDDTCGENPPYMSVALPAVYRQREAKQGDMILRDEDGMYYVLTIEEFDDMYEEVE